MFASKVQVPLFHLQPAEIQTAPVYVEIGLSVRRFVAFVKKNHVLLGAPWPLINTAAAG